MGAQATARWQQKEQKSCLPEFGRSSMTSQGSTPNMLVDSLTTLPQNSRMVNRVTRLPLLLTPSTRRRCNQTCRHYSQAVLDLTTATLTVTRGAPLLEQQILLSGSD